MNDKNLMIELNNYKNENKQLKQQISNLQQEKIKLNNDLIHRKLLLFNIQQKEINNNINNLQNKLKQLKNNNNLNKNVDFNNTIFIHFISADGKIDHNIKCLKTDTFAEVEEKLYQIYNEYRETNNIFLAGGKIIKRFKTIEQNKLKDGEIVQLLYLNINLTPLK